jgi:hypothetical protein
MAFATVPGFQLNGLKREEFIAMGKVLGGGERRTPAGARHARA